MANINIARALTIALVGLSIPAMFYILRSRPHSKPGADSAVALGATASPPELSAPEHPLSQLPPGDVDPLASAEVFLAFGQRDSARSLLESAVASGQVSVADRDLFWATHDLKRTSADVARSTGKKARA